MTHLLVPTIPPHITTETPIAISRFFNLELNAVLLGQWIGADVALSVKDNFLPMCLPRPHTSTIG